MIRAWIAVALLAGSWMFGLDYFYPANPWIWAALVAGGTMLLSGRGLSRFSLWGLSRFSCNENGTVPLLKRWGTVPIFAQRKWDCPLALFDENWIALLLLIPALIFVPWPLKIVPLLIALGLAAYLLPSPHPNPLPKGEGTFEIELLPKGKGTENGNFPKGERTFLQRLAQGAVAAGVILAAQSLALALYIAQTARSHDLPYPLPDLLAGIASLLSIDAATDGSKIVMHSMRQVHRLGATWELLLDPATLCFFVGGLVLLGLAVWHDLPEGRRWPAWIRALRIFTLVIIAWLPVRAGLLIAIYMHRVLRAEPDRALYVMNHFFAPWSLLVFLAIPLLLVCHFLRWNAFNTFSPLPTNLRSVPGEGQGEGGKLRITGYPWNYVFSIILIALAVAIFTVAIVWNPMGHRLGGRVKVVERHSTWEPTTRPYDTTWYGEPSGYNYAALYDYLGQYYEMSRILESDKIDDQTLGQCDVLVIKTPTTRYSQDEVDATDRFVQRGGGVLFIGDHTNIYRTSTIMNDMTRPMGFIFRDDLLFSNEPSPYDQHFEPPWPPHPSLQYMPPMEFAVSCSIDPGFSHGRSVITSTGLWNMPPEYHFENYHPLAQFCADMRYGAFVQVWAAWYGQGRAMAYADSTIFSNFAVFQPGHAEIMLGMIEWLNHANPPLDPRPWLIILGFVPLCAGLILARRGSVAWLVLLAAGICAWAITVQGVAALHRWSMPEPKINKPMTRVVVDRTVSDALLSKGAYTQGDGVGYGMVEQLIARLGYYVIRQEGKASFSGDALVVFCPDRPVDASFREQLERYVAEGGKLLVFDSPENANSTANSLLWPFELSIDHKRAWTGSLTLVDKWPNIDVSQANEVAGGKPIARLGDRSVAAVARHGKGTVMAVGFSSLLSDKNMGDAAMWMVEPDAAMLSRYEVFYSLLRLLVEDKPIAPATNTGEIPGSDVKTKSRIPLQLPELPLQELGPQE